MNLKRAVFLTLVFIFALSLEPRASSLLYAADKGNPPVAHWRFDEGGGGTAYDDVGNNDGTLQPGDASGSNDAVGEMWTRQGKIGGALECDGTNDYTAVAHNSALAPTTAITVASWAYSSNWAGAGDSRILSKTETGGYCVTLNWVDSPNNVAFLVRRNGAYSNASYASTNLSSGWHFFAGTYDGRYARLYVDGVLRGTDDAGGSYPIQYSYDNSFIVGGEAGPSTTPAGNYFNGLIDDIKIYDYARTADQIMVDYNAGKAVYVGAGIDPNEGNPPIGYWKFDENAGTTAYDRSGNGNNGTLTNSPTWTQGENGSAVNLVKESGQYVTVSNESNFDLTTAITIEAWVNISSHDSYAGIVSKTSGNTNGWEIRTQNSQGAIQCRIMNGVDLGPSATISLNEWHHLAGTYSTSDNTIRLYVDGVLKNSIAGSNGIAVNNNSVLIGALGYSSSLTLTGKVDEVKIYNYARTQAQIAYDYNKGKPVAYYKFDEGGGSIAHNEYSTADTGVAPVGWWRMDNASSGSADGVTITDGTGNGNNGTVSSTTVSWVSGKIGQGALSFDGNDYVNLVSSNNITGNNLQTITVSAWVKTSVTAAQYALTINRNDTFSTLITLCSNQDNIGANVSGCLGFLTRNYADTAHVWLAYNGGYNDNQWHFVTAVVNGLTRTLYIDGIKRGTDNEGMQSVTGNTSVACIGSHGGASSFFNGQIDDVRVYRYARTAEQIYNDYRTTHGTLVGDTKFVDGKIGKALQFDGTGDYVELISNTENLLGSDPSEWSYSAWFKTSGTVTSKKEIISNYDSNDYDSLVGIWTGINADGNTGRMFIDVRGTGAPDYLYTPSGTRYDDSAWHYIAVTAKKGDCVKGYIDGVKFTTDGSSSLSTNDYIDNAALRVGALKVSGAIGEYWLGQIDDVRIYNYARSADQILQDYNAGVTSHLGVPSAGVADPWGGALPIAHWKMDENTGVLARDASGNGRDGTLTNGPVWTQGKNGPCLSFDGINDYVTGLATTYEGTISLWMNLKTAPSSGNDRCFINVSPQGTDTRFYLQVRPTGTGELKIATDGTWTDTGYNIPLNSWVHVTAVKNNGNAYIYINGNLVKSLTYSKVGSVTGTLSQGQVGGDANGYLNAYIDDVKIYNYVRTQAQIAWDYNHGKPVGYWRLDEKAEGQAVDTAAGAIKDDSDNNNDGTASNTAWSYITGKYGRCLNFDGNDYINCGTGASLNIANAITVEAWAKPSSLSAAGRGIIGRHISSTDGGGTVRLVNANVQVVTTIGGSYTSFDTTNSPITVSEWNHVVYTYNGSVEKIYVNGVEKASRNNSGVIYTPVPHTWIGDTYSAGAQPFVGLIDDARIYNYARTAEQVMQDYNEGLAAKLGD